MKEVPRKVKYAIRMLEFHTRLVAKYTKIINNYMEDCKKVNSKLNKNIVEQHENNYTIYDYIDEE